MPNDGISLLPMPSNSEKHVLVIDDEPDLRTLYELTLLREGYQVASAGCVKEAIDLLAHNKYDAVITDMRLPDGLGLELLRWLGSAQRSEHCIVMTAYGSAENAVESLKAGAFDYLTKPVDLKQFRGVVASAIHSPRPQRFAPSRSTLEVATAPSVDAGQAALERLVGDSAPMKSVRARVAKVARSMAPVLVHGESGTGKELVATAIHACSHRSNGPFVAVNCGAIPENLLEAEFFGAKKGAYTGAIQDRDGYFQSAQGGTLFLDEIGDLPMAMQSKLLRAIQERRIRSIGSTTEDLIDVRIVSATHKDLAHEVNEGRFRQDLYYRLNVIEIFVPPLRERRSDMPALCTALLAKISADSGSSTPTPSVRLMEELSSLELKGNVRELENLLHRALALHECDALELDGSGGALGLQMDAASLPVAFPPPIASVERALDSSVLPEDLQAFLDAKEREILVRVLEETNFNRTAAAARLKLSLRQMRYRIARLNISLPSGDEDSSDDTSS